jgi:SSS family solute:Na+ symporter
VIETTTVHAAAPSDVARRQAAIHVWDEAQESIAQEEHSQERLRSLGPRPEPIKTGDPLAETAVTGGRAIFWTGPVVAVDENNNILADVVPQPVGPPSMLDENTTRIVKRYDSSVRLQGTGQFRFDFLLYKLFGVDLGECSDSTLRTLDLPPKIIVPFLVMIVVSLFTQPNSKTALDRYYVKMKTPVRGDPQQDAEEMERSYREPDRFNDRKLWPNSNLEIQRPRRSDVVGFVLSVAACFGIIGLAVLITRIGS